jgi:UDP-N-acetylglucosamine/UDP-N-acetylgalactosamine diphosphorylase
MITLQSRLERARERLAGHGQEHVLRHAEGLDPVRLDRLLDQVDALSLEQVRDLAAALHVDGGFVLPADLAPATIVRRSTGDATLTAHGEALLRAGKVACFMVAGGQGTRLGWDAPKGTFPATPILRAPLFRVFAEQIHAARRRYGAMIRWYIMTSPMNDAPTRAFFAEHGHFGLGADTVMFFPQGTLPSLTLDGKLLLAEPDEIAVNPDGHGGSLRALRHAGALDDMLAHGIEHISYFQVDNPLVHVVDPRFIGVHAAHPGSSGEMTSKMVAKRDAAEKVGVFCASAGRTMVVEYSDLPASLAAERDGAGRLRFDAGSIAIHMLSRAFVERLTDHGLALPLHKARKKVPFIGDDGRRVEPATPNAIKMETFVFDAIPMAQSSLVVETDRAEEFAPIKNADGDDSPATSMAAQSARAARWLEAAGWSIPRTVDGAPDCTIELSPLSASCEAECTGLAPRAVERGAACAVHPLSPG